MNKVFFVLLGALVLSGCNSKEVFNTYSSIAARQWHAEQAVEFVFKNTDTISSKNVFINIRNDKDYPYSSLYLISTIKFPDGFRVIDTLEYEMTDTEGKWLGTGYTDIKENKLYLKEKVVFDEQGDYVFSIAHATRGISDIEGRQPLPGIIDVGLSIEKAK